jgi:hypothetical protein
VGIDPHRLAEARSLAAHRVIAHRVRRDPALLEQARARISTWLRTGSIAPVYAQRWQRILAEDVDAIVAAICDPSEEGRALRQSTPFAGVIPPRERWSLWEEVRRELESS